MLHWHLTKSLAESIGRFRVGTAIGRGAFLGALLCIGSQLCILPEVCAQSSDARVAWRLDYAPELSKTERAEIESTVLKTLMRAKERHFAGDAILTQKLKSEGFGFPDCFTQGEPCASGGTFVLDVYNADAYAEAVFSRDSQAGEWIIDLTLNRRYSGSAQRIRRSGRDLSELLRQVLSGLFEMEAEISIDTAQPNLGVWLNNRFIGTAPLSMRISVGEQNIEFKKDGYVSQSWKFDAEKGKLYSKQIDLVPEVAPLTILTPAPDSFVTIDGNRVGPANATYDILPGDHAIGVSAEGYHDFEQEYKVYPGSLQTMQIALRPKSASPYEIRHQNIGTYRFSGFVGYRYANESMSMKKSKAKVGEKGYRYAPSRGGWASGDFHGLTLRLDYEDRYWGLSVFEFDASWAKFGDRDAFEMKTAGSDPIRVNPEDGWMIGFYPAQIKGHYTFWVMQAEALLGIGVSHKKINARSESENFSFAQTAFSVHFNASLKFYMSEESFASLGYDFQIDAADGEKGRHGVVLGIGMQFPVWRRTTSALLDDDADDGAEAEAAEDGASLNGAGGETKDDGDIGGAESLAETAASGGNADETDAIGANAEDLSPAGADLLPDAQNGDGHDDDFIDELSDGND